MTPVTLVSAIAAIAGVAGAFIAILKIGPERQSIFITTAQGAVIVQSGVIDDLREELTSLRARVAACEQTEEATAAKLAKTALERDRLRLENDQLKDRVSHLEKEVKRLKNGAP